MRGEEQRTAVDEGQLDVQPGRRCPDGRQDRVGDKVRFSSCDSTVNINLNFDKKLDSKFWIHATYPCNLYICQNINPPQHHEPRGCEEGEHRGRDGAEGPGDGRQAGQGGARSQEGRRQVRRDPQQAHGIYTQYGL